VGALFPKVWAKLSSLCLHSVFIWAYLNIWSCETFLCHQCLSRFLLGIICKIWVFSRDLLFFWGDAALRSVSTLYSHLWGLLSLTLDLHHTFISLVGDNRTLTFVISFCRHHIICCTFQHLSSNLKHSLPLSYHPASISWSATEPSLIFCCPHQKNIKLIKCHPDVSPCTPIPNLNFLLISSGCTDLRSRGGIRIWGVDLKLPGFRTGVWNFVGAGLGILWYYEC